MVDSFTPYAHNGCRLPIGERERMAAQITDVSLSIRDIAGSAYAEAVADAAAFLRGSDRGLVLSRLSDPVDLFPEDIQQRCDSLLQHVGETVVSRVTCSAKGATTASFSAATSIGNAPLSGFGFLRIGEDGKLHLASKSEHYHASLGHSFPGFALLDIARSVGIPNATHNNTRGHLTRLAEEALIAAANGVARNGVESDSITQSHEPHVLNRVINLETGSLAVEAALKMMLARFYRLDEATPPPHYAGKTPVILVMADNNGCLTANYHGTTIVTQFFRGLWPELRDNVARGAGFQVVPVAINDIQSFRSAVETYDSGDCKIAGFFHEIVMMNYGAIVLDREYLHDVYEICHGQDIPVAVDEIQSCIWSPEFFLFREYGLRPDFVSVGKGFPGGEYPASRILCTAPYDSLSQFGALVTNGQEELASLAYLITMSFVLNNRDYVRDLGEYYQRQLGELQHSFPGHIVQVNGLRHMSCPAFTSSDGATEFVRILRERCIDISTQAYKQNALPVALTKLPLISSYRMVDFLIREMRAALESME